MSVLRKFFGGSFVLLRVSCARCVYLRAYFKPTPMLCDLNRNTTNNSGRRKIPRNQWEPTRDLKQTTWRAGKREWWVLVLYMIGWEGWARVFKTNQRASVVCLLRMTFCPASVTCLSTLNIAPNVHSHEFRSDSVSIFPSKTPHKPEAFFHIWFRFRSPFFV